MRWITAHFSIFVLLPFVLLLARKMIIKPERTWRSAACGEMCDDRQCVDKLCIGLTQCISLTKQFISAVWQASLVLWTNCWVKMSCFFVTIVMFTHLSACRSRVTEVVTVSAVRAVYCHCSRVVQAGNAQCQVRVWAHVWRSSTPTQLSPVTTASTFSTRSPRSCAELNATNESRAEVLVKK